MAVHFTTMPCKPYTDHKVLGKLYFLVIFVPVLTTGNRDKLWPDEPLGSYAANNILHATFVWR